MTVVLLFCVVSIVVFMLLLRIVVILFSELPREIFVSCRLSCQWQLTRAARLSEK